MRYFKRRKHLRPVPRVYFTCSRISNEKDDVHRNLTHVMTPTLPLQKSFIHVVRLTLTCRLSVLSYDIGEVKKDSDAYMVP